MEPISATALATVVIPFITAGIKKLFVKKLPERIQPAVNTVIPIILGMISAGIYTYQQTGDVWLGVAAGLGSGGVASSGRDLYKNTAKVKA